MAPRKLKKHDTPVEDEGLLNNTTIVGSGLVVEQPVSQTLEVNYMPYAMSVIVSRAIPEIDGFKPAHRKLLYTMYLMGLLKGDRAKSAKVVGSTMALNPHGDQAIYDTLVRMTRGNETLLHPYIDSKGNFGKAYSRDMSPSASRYTEAKLESIALELFRDIEKETVEMVDNFDGSMKEPTLFPVTFPSVLVNANTGIAVGMASSVCSFNLKEVCETTIALIRDENHDPLETMPAPDFPGGGLIMYDSDEMKKIYETGRGSVKVRSIYSYDKSANCIDITQIPPSTTIEQIIEKTIDLVKAKKITEINDIRDETGKQGMRITIDLKRGADPEKLMTKLFRMTSLEDSFSCNFNILIAGTPKVMGVREILTEWIYFRIECVKNRIYYDLQKAKEKLHLLQGLAKILVDIDKAIAVIRKTESELEVVPNLMVEFGIDDIQANYVAEIKLRHLNREYILKRLEDIDELEKSIAEMESILKSTAKVKTVIINELKEIIKKYGKDRLSQIVYDVAEDDFDERDEIPDYPVHLFFTKEGYFKKVTPQSLRMSGEHKFKEGDSLLIETESSNAKDLLFFTNKGQVYKSRVADFNETKISTLGDYVATALNMERDETAIYMAVTDDYRGNMLFFFENGKTAKVEMKCYQTKTNRKRLTGAFNTKSPLVAAVYAVEEGEYLLTSSNGRMLLVNSAVLAVKTTRSTQGVAVMTQKKGHRLVSVKKFDDSMLVNPKRYRARNLPAAGSVLPAEEQAEQLSL